MSDEDDMMMMKKINWMQKCKMSKNQNCDELARSSGVIMAESAHPSFLRRPTS
jgi:hypothetical protein